MMFVARPFEKRKVIHRIETGLFNLLTLNKKTGVSKVMGC